MFYVYFRYLQRFTFLITEGAESSDTLTYLDTVVNSGGNVWTLFRRITDCLSWWCNKRILKAHKYNWQVWTVYFIQNPEGHIPKWNNKHINTWWLIHTKHTQGNKIKYLKSNYLVQYKSDYHHTYKLQFVILIIFLH